MHTNIKGRKIFFPRVFFLAMIEQIRDPAIECICLNSSEQHFKIFSLAAIHLSGK